MNRRAFVTAFICATTGCLGSDNDNARSEPEPETGTSDPSEKTTSPTPTTPPPEKIINQRAEIPRNQWLNYPIEPQQQTRFEYQITVTDGPPIDVYLLTSSEYDNFRDQRSFDFLDNGSREGTSTVSVSTEITAGTYQFVVDNSRLGATRPPPENGSEANVRIQATLF